MKDSREEARHLAVVSITLVLLVMLATSLSNLYSNSLLKTLGIVFGFDVVSIVFYFLYHLYLFNSNSIRDRLMDFFLVLFLILTTFSFFLLIFFASNDYLPVNFGYSIGEFIALNAIFGFVFGSYSIIFTLLPIYAFVVNNSDKVLCKMLNFVSEIIGKIQRK